MTTYDAEFEQHIRDLLSNLDDYLKLAENPVARQLAGAQGGKDRMQAVHDAVVAAIGQLRSEKEAGASSRRNRPYRILQLRYIERRGTAEVLNRLALSERQYYREHQRALRTISQIIWDERFADQSKVVSLSLADELDYLSSEKRQASYAAKAEILAALRATQVIAAERGIEIELTEPEQPLSLHMSQPVFRQLIVYLLKALLQSLDEGGRLGIVLRADNGERAIAFAGALDMPAIHGRLQDDATAQALLKTLNARLEVAKPTQLNLRFAQKAQRILIVDDNPDTVALFRRYLANLPYQLLSAQAEAEALRIAQGTPLLCVILDVMLPGKDGWQILQRFKNQPATADIPVLICSVLEMEDLALSLGADGYLKKPPARADLLNTLDAWS